MKLTYILAVMNLLLTGCDRVSKNSITFSGTAQGTRYNITYLAGPCSNYREQRDTRLMSRLRSSKVKALNIT
jgi:hypothetical protein